MATKPLLADLVAQFRLTSAHEVSTVSVGGVDAAKRVQAGEAFDVVVLAAEAIERLTQGGCIASGSRVDLVRSGVAIAVRAGARRPDIASEQAVKRAVLAATSLGYSTGPSGVQLAKLFERWGIAQTIAPRIVQAPPGVPVGSLVANGSIELGFQQLSELMHLDGIDLLGPLPAEIQIVTTFSAALLAASPMQQAARELLEFMAAPAVADTKRRHGMDPA